MGENALNIIRINVLVRKRRKKETFRKYFATVISLMLQLTYSYLEKNKFKKILCYFENNFIDEITLETFKKAI